MYYMILLNIIFITWYLYSPKHLSGCILHVVDFDQICVNFSIPYGE